MENTTTATSDVDKERALFLLFEQCIVCYIQMNKDQTKTERLENIERSDCLYMATKLYEHLQRGHHSMYSES